MKTETTEGGGKRFTFHQSDLTELTICPERARLQWTGQVVDHDTAESAIGTATHAAAERILGGAAPHDAIEAAVGQFRGLSEGDGFRWVKVKTHQTAEQHIVNCVNTWLRDIQPLLGPTLAVELPFHVKLDENYAAQEKGYPPIEIWLGGTIDFIDPYGLWDWKTCSRITKYTTQGWELRRWAIQPSVYTYAAYHLGLCDEPPIPFSYGAMQRTPCTSAVLTVERTEAHWQWIRRLCWNAAHLMDEQAHGWWPMNDQHALCSADWCPAWSQCKGAALAMAA